MNKILFLLIAFLFFSCASMPQKTVTEEVVSDETPKTETKPIAIQNTSSKLENEFKDLLKNIDIKIVSAPKSKKIIYSGNDWTESYVVSVTKNDEPIPNFSVTVSYPSSRQNNVIVYENMQLTTDDDGKINFLPNASNIAIKDKITFYPTPVSSSPEIQKLAMEISVDAPFIVKSKYVTHPGGIIYVWNYNENGKPTMNNFELLQCMRNAGVNAGNAPVSSSSYLDKPNSVVYNDCKKIVGDAARFLIVGYFKYAKPAETNESGATVTLEASVSGIDMTNGNELIKITKSLSVTDKSAWDAEKKCRTQLATILSDELIYGM